MFHILPATDLVLYNQRIAVCEDGEYEGYKSGSRVLTAQINQGWRNEPVIGLSKVNLGYHFEVVIVLSSNVVFLFGLRWHVREAAGHLS